MYCNDHQREYEFLCKSEGCNYTLLCFECRKTHLAASKSDRTVHLSCIVQLRKSFEDAEENLIKNKNTLQQLIEPFENETKALETIELQKKKLMQERDVIINKIKQSFDEEIKQLEKSNQQIMIRSKDGIPLEQIHNKIKKIKEL